MAEVRRNGAEFVDECCTTPSVVDGTLDLGAMSDDAAIAKQAGHIACAKVRNRVDTESCKHAPEVLALAQDHQPRQASLKHFERQSFE